MKRGLLDVCVLAAIKEEDSYGYQIIKDSLDPKSLLSVSRALSLFAVVKRNAANVKVGLKNVLSAVTDSVDA